MTTRRTTPNPKKIHYKRGEPDGFEVTFEQSIGFVSFDREGDMTPMTAAFTLIASHHERTGEPGSYRMPGPHGEVKVVVEVETM